jgi:hypothetical protein
MVCKMRMAIAHQQAIASMKNELRDVLDGIACLRLQDKLYAREIETQRILQDCSSSEEDEDKEEDEDEDEDEEEEDEDEEQEQVVA